MRAVAALQMRAVVSSLQTRAPLSAGFVLVSSK
jgi:hypothetical protein